MVGKGGTTAYNCFNFAWLKKYDPAGLWKKCDITSDYQFRHYPYFTQKNTPGGVGWVGSDAKHAVYVVKEEVSYRNENNNLKPEPLVKSKWTTSGPLVQHPVSLCKCYSNPSNPSLTWYC